jgi:hypothetical protein
LWGALFVGLLGTCASVGACAPAPPTEVLSKNDPFKPYSEIESLHHRVPVDPGWLVYRLVAQTDRGSGASTILVKVQHSYTSRHRNNYESARNAKAQALPFNVVARYGQCRLREDCPLDELYTVQIPEADLRAARTTGYPFKVFPRVGNEILITVPPEMIGSLFKQLDASRASGKMAAATKL